MTWRGSCDPSPHPRLGTRAKRRRGVALHLSDNLAPESARLMLSGQVTVGFEVAVQFSRL